jgi:hypothetical protein
MASIPEEARPERFELRAPKIVDRRLRPQTKEQGRGPAQNEAIPIRPNLLELFDRDFQRLEAPFGGGPPTTWTAWRHGTCRAPFANMEVI